MRRLARTFANVVTAASLALLVLSVVAWGHSYRTAEYVGRSGAGGWWGVLSMAGIVRAERGTYDPHDDSGWSYVSDPQRDPTGLRSEVAARDRRGGPLKGLGFAYARVEYDGDGRRVRHAVYAPHWFFAIAFAVLPALAVRRSVRARRRGPNACRQCGDDLRATPERCPECGSDAGSETLCTRSS